MIESETFDKVHILKKNYISLIIIANKIKWSTLPRNL